LRRCTLISWS